MKRQIALIIVTAILSINLTGCTEEKEVLFLSDGTITHSVTENTEPAPEKMISAIDENGKLPISGSINNINYIIGDNGYYDMSLSEKGHHVNTTKDGYRYTICSGEHSTGGYSIDIINVEADENNNIVITVEETSPEPMDIVTQAFTYPTCTITLSGEVGKVIIKTTNGTELSKLNEEG